MRAFVFPGQGSQFVGMGKDLIELSPQAREKFETADKLYEGKLVPTMFDGPEDALRQTYFTQPAIFLCSVVLADALRERNVAFHMVAGHSLGEYSALYAAGALDFQPLLELLKLRASLMQSAGERRPGAMAAIIGLDGETIRKLCSETGKIVVVANDNAPDQVVVSGEPEAVAEVGEKCKAAGAKRVLPLNVSGAFHSPLLDDAAAELTSAIDRAPWRDVQIPVVTNVSAQPRTRADEIRQELTRQIISPVRWVDIIRRMVADGVTEFVEVGPGKVLAGLIRRIARDAQVINVGTRAELEDFLAKIS
ncbi:MAG: ACP S-malonyltransferase [Candidatus Sumerlaeaceae bacterium]|nr:ACP S-malonyltransferase [Candidatus Sumerlaeaceae bacterium]